MPQSFAPTIFRFRETLERQICDHLRKQFGAGAFTTRLVCIALPPPGGERGIVPEIRPLPICIESCHLHTYVSGSRQITIQSLGQQFSTANRFVEADARPKRMVFIFQISVTSV